MYSSTRCLKCSRAAPASPPSSWAARRKSTGHFCNLSGKRWRARNSKTVSCSWPRRRWTTCRAGIRRSICAWPRSLCVAPQRWEGFGLTPLEAMACGVPMIATTVGAFDELVVEGAIGRLIPPGEVEPMRAAVDAALASPDTLRQWSAAARRHVEQGFRIEDEAEALNALYRELLGGCGGGT